MISLGPTTGDKVLAGCAMPCTRSAASARVLAGCAMPCTLAETEGPSDLVRNSGVRSNVEGEGGVLTHAAAALSNE